MSPANGQPARSSLKLALENYEPVPNSSQPDAVADDEDSDFCIISIPCDMPLEDLDGIKVIEDAAQEIVITSAGSSSNKRLCQIQHKQVTKTTFPRRVLMNGTRSLETSEESVIAQCVNSVIKINERSKDPVVNLGHCIPRPHPPSVPDGLKERFKPFGWQEPVVLDGSVKTVSSRKAKGSPPGIKNNAGEFVSAKLERLPDSDAVFAKMKKKKKKKSRDQELCDDVVPSKRKKSTKIVKEERSDLNEMFDVPVKKKKEKKNKKKCKSP